MGEFTNIITPFFSTPHNYEQMLKRIAGFVVYEVYLITLFLRDIPQIKSFFTRIETYKSLGALIGVIPHAHALNVAGFGIAILVAVISHISRVHDKISDLFGIRARFEKNEILIPLATNAGCQLSSVLEKQINKERDNLMSRVFYQYASSRKNEPLVDKHDIEHALADWSWFWAGVEGILYALIGSVTAFVFRDYGLSLAFLLTSVIMLLSCLAQYPQLKRNARRQLNAIIADASAKEAVKTVFNAL